MKIAKKSRATRKDVAMAAGVCVTTVTHALSNTPGTRVNPETRERIKHIAKEFDYRPSFVGKALTTGKNYTIGLLQPSLESLHFTYYQNIIIGMSEAMEETDYNILSLYRKNDFRYMKVIEQGRVDGMVILQSDPSMIHIEKVIETGIPTVIVNKNINSIVGEKVGCICPDHDKFMEDVVSDFRSLGCKSVLAIHNYERDDANVNMYNAFNKTVKKYVDCGITGMTLMPDWDNFKAQCINIFKSGQHWDGIFIDGYGNVLIEVASECGLEAGKDFILITTNTDKNCFTSRKLEYSFYFQQGQKIGGETWKLMASMLNGDIEKNKTVLVPYLRQLVNNSLKGI